MWGLAALVGCCAARAEGRVARSLPAAAWVCAALQAAGGVCGKKSERAGCPSCSPLLPSVATSAAGLAALPRGLSASSPRKPQAFPLPW